ncbi:hypothetical protein LTR17_022030 [Elasticomyces elasticus]|nr:hypothetical protein LTR17_022030 [Elasticomyces elasticus]
MDDLHTALTILDELKRDPNALPWSTRWQCACETVWAALGEDREVPEDAIGAIISLLEQGDKLAVAAMVIPELREPGMPVVHSKHQEEIIKQTREARGAAFARSTKRQEDFDDASYSLEKEKLRDAEMHRARVLLHHSAGAGSSEEEAIQRWLDQAPAFLRNG